MIAGEAAPPVNAPLWLIVLTGVLGVLGAGGGIGAIVIKLLDRRKTKVDADEVFTRVAVALVEPLRARLESTEARAAEADKLVDELRRRTQQALAEADAAATEAHKLRRLVQRWHRAIMDPSATIEWLRQLVGPDEPAI